MKIAIHHRKGSFSERWIDYCNNNKIDYKIVNAYRSDIITQTAECEVFMWHHYSDSDYKDAIFASRLLMSFEANGKKVFPNVNTTWHFNDKVGQKYLLEAISAPFVPSYVFYSKEDALKWIENTSFPIVFKLRSGAGSMHVKLVKNINHAKKLIKKSFGKGFSQLNRFEYFKDHYNMWKKGKDKLGLLKGIVRLFISSDFSKNLNKENGYIYFQDYIPNNSFDIRVVVIGNKAFALKRVVRGGDFRASGSGNLIYDKNQIDIRCVKIGFEVNTKIKSQCIAYDFIFDKDNNPLIVEISYGFAMFAYDKCEGYWDNSLNWYEGENFNFCGWMVDDIINNE